MKRLPILLVGLINSEPNDTVNYNIAYYLLNHAESMETMNIGELAKQCNVSKATVSRFCRELGFESFYEMRADFGESIEEGKISQVRDMTDRQFLADVSAYGERMLDHVPEQKLEQLADWINRYQNVVVMGHIQSGNAALMLQHDVLNLTNHVVQVLNRPSEQMAFFEDVEKPTLVILFSIHGKFFEDLYGKNQVPKMPAGSAVCMLTTDSPTLSYEGVDLHLDTGTGNDYASGNLSLILLERVITLHCRRKLMQERRQAEQERQSVPPDEEADR